MIILVFGQWKNHPNVCLDENKSPENYSDRRLGALIISKCDWRTTIIYNDVIMKEYVSITLF
jgi:hypothetical protein